MNLEMFFVLLFLLLPLYLLLRQRISGRFPPGSLGLPIIGQSITFRPHAMRKNTDEEWLRIRIRKYVPVWKTSLLGKPTVFLSGAANKFIYNCDGSILAGQKPLSVRRICGQRNIFELSGHEHKRVRGVLVSLLKPEVLRQYVGEMDERIRKHFEMHWHGKQKVSVCPFYLTTKYQHIS